MPDITPEPLTIEQVREKLDYELSIPSEDDFEEGFDQGMRYALSLLSRVQPVADMLAAAREDGARDMRARAAKEAEPDPGCYACGRPDLRILELPLTAAD